MIQHRVLRALLLSYVAISSVSAQDSRRAPFQTTSPFQPPKANDYTFIVNSGAGLDTGCTYRSGGPLLITLPIDRVLGDLNKLKQNGLVPANVRIEFPAYDVDSAGAPGVPPERDRVSINGNVVPGEFMSGLNNTWVMQRFDVPIEWLNFAPDPGAGNTSQPQNNQLRIDIDVLSAPQENWCTAVDWVAATVDNPIPPRPWIGAHGIFSDSSIWQTLWVPAIRNLGIPAGGGPNMGNLDSIQSNAGKVGQAVQRSLQRWGVDKVNIVAHSKGGLDSRHYIETNNTIENLVQLGTPNAGSPLADAIEGGSIRVLGLLGNIVANLLAGGVGGYQLTTPHMALYNAFHGSNPKTQYLAIAGDYRPGSYFNDTWRRAVTDLIVGPGDVIVPITSVHALNFTARGTVTCIGPGDRLCEHTQMHGDNRFFNLARPRIVAPGVAIQAARLAPGVVPANLPAVQRTESFAGRLNPGATATHTVPIDRASTVSFLMFAADGNLTFTLKNPSGTTIQPTDPGVNYEKSAIPGGWIFSYAFQGVVPTGNWTAQLQSTSAASIDYSLNAWLENSDVTLAGTTTPSAGPVNTSFTIRATLKNGTLPITGATARAFVKYPDNTTSQTVMLLDNGTGPDATANDGIYSGVFSSTAQIGIYQLAITGRGNFLPGQPFSREIYAQIGVSQSNSRILPGLADLGRDTNGNGQFDYLVVQVPLQITAPGVYRLAGTLRDSAGNEQTVSRIANLTPSSTGLELLFDGSTIFARGVDGPYTVTSVRLAEEISNQLVPVAELTTPYTTSAYSYTQFEGAALALTGAGSAQGIDLNSNGKYDLLRVQLGLNVQNAGFYTWSARLRDSSGREITLSSGQGSLPAGVSNIQLDFNGTAIGQNGVDGPYQVSDLLINGPNTLSVATALQTPAFPASAFEGYVPSSGPPRIAGQVQSITSLGGGQYRLNLAVVNNGQGAGRSVFINQIAFRALGGPAASGFALVSPQLPISIGDLAPGAASAVQLTVSVPAGVTRFSITESGTTLDTSGTQTSFSAAQSVNVP